MENNLAKIASNFVIGSAISITKFGNGLINDTYIVKTLKGRFVLQKLHKIFKPSLLKDIEVVTSYIYKNGFLTPLVVKSKEGELGMIEGRDCWRMMTYIPGRCYEMGINRNQAFEAAKFLGSFHNILSRFNYHFKHKLPGFYDSDHRIEKLKKCLSIHKKSDKAPILFPLAEKIIKNYGMIGRYSENLPDRITHGDLKVNNIRFNMAGTKAVALLDLDTMGRNKVTVDISGAMRTWCNKAHEDDIINSKFDLNVFDGMIKGYLKMAKFITKEELMALPSAIETTLLILASRFVVDAFEESYFKLTDKYLSLYEQNRVKALAQLALYDDYKNKEKTIAKIIKQGCRQLS